MSVIRKASPSPIKINIPSGHINDNLAFDCFSVRF